MKRFLMLALGASLALPLAAHAQNAPAQLNDHAHDHAAEAKPRADETTSDYLWRKSDEAFHDGDYPRAVELHKAIVAYDPTDIESYSVASWLLWSMGKGDEAVAFIQRGLKANPNDSDMWDAAGQHYDLQKRFSDSRSAYAKAVELAGANADQMMRRRLAHANEKAGDLPGSIMAWRALVHDYPAEAVNKNNLTRVEGLLATKGAGAAPVAAAGAVGVAVVSLMVYRRRAI